MRCGILKHVAQISVGCGALVMLLASAPSSPAFALGMQITNISDFALGSWGYGDPDITAHIDVCIGSLLNSPLGGYAINAIGNNGYVLTNGTQQIPYTLSWDDGGSGNLGNASSVLSNNVKLTSQINANAVSALCAVGGPTARLNLKIAKEDMNAALAGTYSGTITLNLTAN